MKLISEWKMKCWEKPQTEAASVYIVKASSLFISLALESSTI